MDEEPLKRIIVAFLSGVLFALGLGLSGMTQPAKIFAFLNLAGAWDPTLMLVMGGAIAVYGPVFYLSKRRRAPLFDDRWHIPPPWPVDRRLMIGAVVFGMGWGIGGYCPGPAIVSIAGHQIGTLVFLISMMLGMRLVPKASTGAKEPLRN
ncbi:membrane protein [Planctomyces bekefii]|uniref:Membrane protein n=1 Tax=Planctomyces bekefii TaxID=1653850 RepID=A0A5C6M5G0_9PLAN|nr:membrane protein [Planctomyces bekefii]